MVRSGLPLLVTGMVAAAAGIAIVVTAIFMTLETPLTAPGVPKAGAVAWRLDAAPTATLPRVVAPGVTHTAYAARVVVDRWDPRLTSATVEIILTLTPPGRASGDWATREGHVFTGAGQAWDARLTTNFDGLLAPPGYPETWSARLGTIVTYHWRDGRDESAPLAGTETPIQVGPPELGGLSPAAGDPSGLLAGVAITAAGLGVWAWGLRRYRYEHRVVRVLPRVLTGDSEAR